MNCEHIKCNECDLYMQAAKHWNISRKEAKEKILNFIFVGQHGS